MCGHVDASDARDQALDVGIRNLVTPRTSVAPLFVRQTFQHKIFNLLSRVNLYVIAGPMLFAHVHDQALWRLRIRVTKSMSASVTLLHPGLA